MKLFYSIFNCMKIIIMEESFRLINHRISHNKVTIIFKVTFSDGDSSLLKLVLIKVDEDTYAGNNYPERLDKYLEGDSGTILNDGIKAITPTFRWPTRRYGTNSWSDKYTLYKIPELSTESVHSYHDQFKIVGATMKGEGYYDVDTGKRYQISEWIVRCTYTDEVFAFKFTNHQRTEAVLWRQREIDPKKHLFFERSIPIHLTMMDLGIFFDESVTEARLCCNRPEIDLDTNPLSCKTYGECYCGWSYDSYTSDYDLDIVCIYCKYPMTKTEKSRLDHLIVPTLITAEKVETDDLLNKCLGSSYVAMKVFGFLDHPSK